VLVVDDKDTCAASSPAPTSSASPTRPSPAANPRATRSSASSSAPPSRPSAKPDGSLDRDKIFDHVGALVDEAVDIVAVSTAHGHTAGVGDVVNLSRGQFKDLPIIAGKRDERRGRRVPRRRRRNAIKIGQARAPSARPASWRASGIPQLTALHVSAQGAAKEGRPPHRRRRITKSGDIVKALTLSDAVILGGLLAGCREAPGEIMEISGKLYKQYRGMGSHAAMKAGFCRPLRPRQEMTRPARSRPRASRPSRKSPARWTTCSQPHWRRPERHGYLGAKDLGELRKKARYVA